MDKHEFKYRFKYPYGHAKDPEQDWALGLRELPDVDVDIEVREAAALALVRGLGIGAGMIDRVRAETFVAAMRGGALACGGGWRYTAFCRRRIVAVARVGTWARPGSYGAI